MHAIVFWLSASSLSALHEQNLRAVVLPRIRTCLAGVQDGPSSTVQRIVVIVECAELMSHHRARRRVIVWPVVEELLQCVYGDLARCAFALCGNMLEPSVDVVLVGCAIANGGHHVEDRVVLGADSIDLFHLREESPEGIARTSTLVEAFRTRHSAKFSSTREVMVPECTEPRTDAFAYKVFRQLPASRQHDATAQSYSSVVLGGTFDHLHAGHKIMLTMCAWLSHERVTCGVTTDILLKNKRYAEELESIDTRISNVRQFLTMLDPSLGVNVVPIDDVYGPTATEADIGAIVVSRETVRGANMINAKRVETGLPELVIFIVGLVAGSFTSGDGHDARVTSNDDDDAIGFKLSSTSIRAWLASNRGTE